VIQSARWIRALVCLTCDFCYFSFICLCAVHLHPSCVVWPLFSAGGCHNVVAWQYWIRGTFGDHFCVGIDNGCTRCPYGCFAEVVMYLTEITLTFVHFCTRTIWQHCDSQALFSVSCCFIDWWMVVHKAVFAWNMSVILISNFCHVPNVVCFLLGNSPASEFYMPTFRNTLSVPSS